MAGVCRTIAKRRERGSRFSIVVVAEGAFLAGGDKVVQLSAEQNLGVERLGGVARYVAAEIEKCFEMETRVVVLGHVQRGGSPSPFDRNLGSRFGVKAVQLIEQGLFGRMVALAGRTVVSVEIESAVGSLNRIDPEGDLVRTAEELGVMVGR
jgi:6-phosphofructokinase 1